mgnify:CR=1 FL=1
MVTRWSGSNHISSPGLVPYASWNASRFLTTWLARNSLGECGSITDPTGCGDAFRAGLIHGITAGRDWETTGRMANLMGALKVEHPGTQNQRFDWDGFADQFREQFGYAL